MRVPREEFERLVTEAIDGLPEEFAEHLDNVEFMVEDYPSREDHAARGIEPGGLLLGVYHGVPLTKRSPFASGTLPDEITLFQRNIERISRSRREIVEQVRQTVLHEIAHHLGISDERLRQLGY
jgi:predicted Zn-dependent protease with MMP-like domain